MPLTFEPGALHRSDHSPRASIDSLAGATNDASAFEQLDAFVDRRDPKKVLTMLRRKRAHGAGCQREEPSTGKDLKLFVAQVRESAGDYIACFEAGSEAVKAELVTGLELIFGEPHRYSYCDPCHPDARRDP
jgi:hypothetical protein